MTESRGGDGMRGWGRKNQKNKKRARKKAAQDDTKNYSLIERKVIF